MDAAAPTFCPDCTLCPRLARFLVNTAHEYPEYHCKPVAPFGELVHFGDAGGLPAPIDPDQLYPRSLKVSAFGLDVKHDPEAAAQARRDLVAWALDGTLRFRIHARLPLTEAAEAHRLIEGRRTTGKIILVR